MKKLLLATTFVAAGFTGTLSAKGHISKESKTSQIVAAKCYDNVYDKYGNVIGQIEVKCPDIIVPGA